MGNPEDRFSCDVAQIYLGNLYIKSTSGLPFGIFSIVSLSDMTSYDK